MFDVLSRFSTGTLTLNFVQFSGWSWTSPGISSCFVMFFQLLTLLPLYHELPVQKITDSRVVKDH